MPVGAGSRRIYRCNSQNGDLLITFASYLSTNDIVYSLI